MLKLEDNPAIIGGGVKSLRELSGRWWVAHCKSRCEKALAWDLTGRGIGYFLPMVERVTFSGGRKRRGMTALFPSYVFFCGSAEDRTAALTTDRVCTVIEVEDQGKLVGELAQIELALRDTASLEPYPSVAVGQTCRVKSGPLEGLVGVVVEAGQRSRLVLRVSILGQSVAVEIEAGLLERAA